MVRQQVEDAVDAIAGLFLEVAPDAAVDHRPDGEWQAPVGDLLGDHVLEQIRLIGFAIERHEIERSERVEVLDDAVEGAELRVGPGQGRRPEDATDDARDLQRPAWLLRDGVDA